MTATILLAACGVSQGGDSVAQLPVKSVPAEAVARKGPGATACPSQDFGRFLKDFSNRVEVQRAFIRYPYETTVYDPSDLEAEPIVTRLAEGQVTFPIMLGDAELSRHGALMQTRRLSKEHFEVPTHGQGSGAYTMTFDFRYQDGCWFLISSVDSST